MGEQGGAGETPRDILNTLPWSAPVHRTRPFKKNDAVYKATEARRQRASHGFGEGEQLYHTRGTSETLVQ